MHPPSSLRMILKRILSLSLRATSSGITTLYWLSTTSVNSGALCSPRSLPGSGLKQSPAGWLPGTGVQLSPASPARRVLMATRRTCAAFNPPIGPASHTTSNSVYYATTISNYLYYVHLHHLVLTYTFTRCIIGGCYKAHRSSQIATTQTAWS